MISLTHHAVAWIMASDTLAPPPGLAFEQPFGAIHSSGYCGWSYGGYLWTAGNWGSRIGLNGGVAQVYGYYGEGFSDGNGAGQHIYYYVNASHVRSDDNGEMIPDTAATGPAATREAREAT